MHKAKEIVGKRIRFLREQKRMTQQELADLLNIDKQYVWKLENGQKNLSMNYLDKLIQCLEKNHTHEYLHSTPRRSF